MVILCFFFFLNKKILSDLALMSHDNFVGFFSEYFFYFQFLFLFSLFLLFLFFYFFDWQQWATKDMTMVEILSTLHKIVLISFPQ